MSPPADDARARRPRPHVIRTARLALRVWDPAEAEELAECTAVNRAHLEPWMPWATGLPHTPREVAERIRGWADAAAAGEDLNLSVRELATDVLVGALGLHERVGAGGLEVGYWIDREACGRGYATEAAGAATRVALELLGVLRVELRCDPRNAGSRRVAEKLGFAFEGVGRARFAWPDGSWRDTAYHSLLADELAASPAGRVDYQAFDATGAPLPPSGPLPLRRT